MFLVYSGAGLGTVASTYYHVMLHTQEIAGSMKLRIAEFVVYLLQRVFEPHTSTSHLARYSRFITR